MNPLITIILPYYNQPRMLLEQLRNWACYTDHTRAYLRLLIVDDGSPQSALSALSSQHIASMADWGARLYRINQDIPWNRGEARNIGTAMTETEWVLHMDLDHVLPPEAAEKLVLRYAGYNAAAWYRFRRFRVGAADHTRNKDALDRDVRYGEIKPHIDSYLCTKMMYWKAGGYDLRYSGCLGGGSPFLADMAAVAGPALLAPPDTFLHVHTTDSVSDASALLDRDTSEYKRRRKAIGTTPKGPPVQHEYERVL